MVVGDHLLKELTKCSNEYINLFGGIDKFEELKRSILVVVIIIIIIIIQTYL